MRLWRPLLLIHATVGVIFTIAAQENYVNVEYEVIAKGMNAPLNDVFAICYNKYYNLEMLSTSFRMKNNLEGKPAKKKMLVEIFLGERTSGAVEIKLNRVVENSHELIVDYEIINGEINSDDTPLHPYLIIQISKSKKQIVCIENGQRRTAGQKLYIDN